MTTMLDLTASYSLSSIANSLPGKVKQFNVVKIIIIIIKLLKYIWLKLKQVDRNQHLLQTYKYRAGTHELNQVKFLVLIKF